MRSCLRRAGRLPKLPGRGSLPFVGRLPPCIHAVKNGQRKRCCGSAVRDKLEINPEVEICFNQLHLSNLLLASLRSPRSPSLSLGVLFVLCLGFVRDLCRV